MLRLWVLGWNTARPEAIGIIPGPAVILVRPSRRSGGSRRGDRGLQWLDGRLPLSRSGAAVALGGDGAASPHSLAS
jgi:hypothetical protein